MISEALKARTKELLNQRLERTLAAATSIIERPELSLSVPTAELMKVAPIVSTSKSEADILGFKDARDLRILFKEVFDVPRDGQSYLLKKTDALVVIRYECNRGFMIFDGKNHNGIHYQE